MKLTQKLVQCGIYIGNSLRYIKETVVYKEFPKSINLFGKYRN